METLARSWKRGADSDVLPPPRLRDAAVTTVVPRRAAACRGHRGRGRGGLGRGHYCCGSRPLVA